MEVPREKLVESVVYNYLKNNGYLQALETFKKEKKLKHGTESPLDPNMMEVTEMDLENSVGNFLFTTLNTNVVGAGVDPNSILSTTISNTPAKIEDSYRLLVDWAQSSLDKYKNELLLVVYPIFVHCYIEMVEKGFSDEAAQFMYRHFDEHSEFHSSELRKLQAVTTPLQTEEDEITRTLKKYKFNLSMCSYSYSLLINFLQQPRHLNTLAIVNRSISITIYSGEPDPINSLQHTATITGSTKEEMDNINNRDIHWGLLRDRLASIEAALGTTVTAAPPPPPPPPPEEGDKMEVDDDKKDGSDSGKKSKRKAPLKKKQKKDSMGLDPDKKSKGKEKDDKSDSEGGSSGSGSSDRIEIQTMDTMIPLPRLNDATEAQMLDDIKMRVPLKSTALPSVCSFTFLHSSHSLNTIEISQDASLVVAGFADSSIKLWDCKKDHSRIFGTTSSTASGSVSTTRNKRKTDYIQLLGHSGPVYSCSFSPDNQYLMSCSEDNTARLWSMETRTNLVVYRGHNYPVWDVNFSPLGYYFATASHDRTARLWATDSIYPLRIFSGHLADVDCVRFHPNCNYIATGSSDNSIRLWEINSGNCVRIFTGHYGGIKTMAFSLDGRYLVSAGEDKRIIVWDLAMGKRVNTLIGHQNTIYSLDFSAEGSLLVSGGADNTVRVWDATEALRADNGADIISSSISPDEQDKLLLKTFPTKDTPVFGVKFTRRNLLLAAGVLNNNNLQ